jgi:hypothetical protein
MRLEEMKQKVSTIISNETISGNEKRDRILFLFGVSNCFKVGDEITQGEHDAKVVGFPEVEYKMHVKYKHNDVFDNVDPREWKHK